MLYPCFSWTRINEIFELSKKYSKKRDKLYDEIYNTKKLLISDRFKHKLKQYITYKIVSELYGSEFLFMIRKNNEIIEGKKNPEEVQKDYWMLKRVFEDGIGFIYSPTRNDTGEQIEKEYQTELNRLHEIK